MTDGTVTIFLEDTRVTTNVINNGERAVGTQASQEVAHTVLEEGSVYTGPADVAGVTYQTAYQHYTMQKGKPSECGMSEHHRKY
ncbi:cache domain-containing protein [Thalassobacillus sp. C254]|uniref:cache domain-containing protein n=1 Tax=Thalassobacillus sp. C254 TaxID=1225341 RepID=UPI0022B6354A|nr:cache domain-containing protein [Thalassobacillus sp. C254]